MSQLADSVGTISTSSPLRLPAKLRQRPIPPRRTARYEDEPGFSEATGLWLYGNVRLLHAKLAYVALAAGPANHRPDVLDYIQCEAEEIVLSGRILVTGIHNPAHMRAAIVPLRWGSPRIVVMSGGFQIHLGPELNKEPFREANLWRDCWDARTDLAISRRAPHSRQTYALFNPTIDRLVANLAKGECKGLNSPGDLLTPLVNRI